MIRRCITMNKNFKIIAMFMTITFIMMSFMACGKSSSEKTTKDKLQGKSSSNMKQYKNTIMGEVVDISGNEVTLKIIKAPDKNTKGNEESTKEEKSKRGGNNSGTPSKEGNLKPSTTGDGQQGKKMQREYTGEEKKILIPVGVKVVSYTFSDNAMKEQEINITSIKSGDTLNIMYSDDGDTIERVVLNERRGGQGATGNKNK